MERTEEALRERVRETPLSERLKTCEKYIASMCAERRPPKMTIPLQHYDEDFYIYTTLADAQATIAALTEALECALLEKPLPNGEYAHHAACNGDRRKPAGTVGVSCSCRVGRATIAALQARVKELEESRDAWKASQECSEKAYMALVNQIPAERFDYDPVNVALLDGAKEQEIIGRKQIADLQGLLKRTDENREQWRKLCQEAQSQLTQRTAELEAAKREREVWKEKAELRGKEACEQRAELERVSLLSSHNERRFEMLEKKYKELRTLVAALPKVEGEIDVYTFKNTNQVVVTYKRGVIIGTLYGLDHAKPVAALYKHRQGM